MRFSNQFMSAIWDNKMIDNIQITMKEDFGTEGRGGYYDSYGVIRDVVQNHLLQVRTLWRCCMWLIAKRRCSLMAGIALCACAASGYVPCLRSSPRS